jgi:DNA-binding transcriptional LysR family regulator
MFDWEDLRHFGALAREHTLSAAARGLKVDHATVARRIAALEASLGIKLVDRRPRSYVLTADGKRIAALAARMEETSFAVGRAVRAVQPGLVGEVSISAPPLLASTLIAPRLAELRNAHPDIRVRLIGEKRSASLSRREADLAVRLSRPTEKRLVVRKIGAIAFMLYATPGYLAALSPRASNSSAMTKVWTTFRSSAGSRLPPAAGRSSYERTISTASELRRAPASASRRCRAISAMPTPPWCRST